MSNSQSFSDGNFFRHTSLGKKSIRFRVKGRLQNRCGDAFCFVLFCFVLFCFVLFCFVLFCFVLFCFVLFCFVLFCFVLFRFFALNIKIKKVRNLHRLVLSYTS